MNPYHRLKELIYHRYGWCNLEKAGHYITVVRLTRKAVEDRNRQLEALLKTPEAVESRRKSLTVMPVREALAQINQGLVRKGKPILKIRCNRYGGFDFLHDQIWKYLNHKP